MVFLLDLDLGSLMELLLVESKVPLLYSRCRCCKDIPSLSFLKYKHWRLTYSFQLCVECIVQELYWQSQCFQMKSLLAHNSFLCHRE